MCTLQQIYHKVYTFQKTNMLLLCYIISSISEPSTIFYIIYVVATTCRNGTYDMLTSAKLSVGYLVVEITRELDKEPSLYCSSIYINTIWSVLQQCVYLMSYYSSTMLLFQGHHVMSMCPDIILFNLHHHACTVMECFGSNILFYLFFFLILYFFFFFFSFRTMKKARNKEVT